MSGWPPRIRSAASRTDACDARSSVCSSREAPGISLRIEPRASSALPWSRDAITTNAPFRASSRETSRPSPPFAPVTTATLPVRSEMSAVVQAMVDAMSRSGEGLPLSLRSGSDRRYLMDRLRAVAGSEQVEVALDPFRGAHVLWLSGDKSR